MSEKKEGPYKYFPRPKTPRTKEESPVGNPHWGIIIATVILVMLILLPVSHYLTSRHNGQQAQEVEKVNRTKTPKHSAAAAKKKDRQVKKTKKKTYVVKNGDTLSEIAIKEHVSVSRLAALNNLGSSPNIRAGQTLKIK